MKMQINFLLVAGLSFVTLSCVSPEKHAAEAPKTEKVTAAATSGQFRLRPMREVQLANGLKILYINDNSLPRLSMTLLAKVGVRQEPKGKEGLNALMAQLLEQGTQTRTATVLADEIGQLGTEVNIEPGYDFTVVSMDALVNSADKLISLFSDMVMNPAFVDTEVVRAKSQVLAQQKKKVDNPSNYANDAFDAFLFQGSSYSNDIGGTPQSVRKISKQDVIRHYLSYYRPNNSLLAVVGRVNKDVEAKVNEVFGKWAGKPIKDLSPETTKAIAGHEVKLVTKPGLEQAQIRIGHIGIRRSDPDFLKLRVANVALGGEFGSRLNQRVRDDLGLTYSIHSYFEARANEGPFAVNTFTKNETVGKTVTESLKVLNDFVAEGITEAELRAAKEQLMGQLPRAIETADRLAFNVLVLNFYGVPLSYLQDFNKNVEAMTLADVNLAIKNHIDPKNLRILVYADEKKVGPQLAPFRPLIEHPGN